jgi:hypothetical protein
MSSYPYTMRQKIKRDFDTYGPEDGRGLIVAAGIPTPGGLNQQELYRHIFTEDGHRFDQHMKRIHRFRRFIESSSYPAQRSASLLLSESLDNFYLDVDGGIERYLEQIIEVFPEFSDGLDMRRPDRKKDPDSFDGRNTERYRIARLIYYNPDMFFLTLLLSELGEKPSEDTIVYGLEENLKKNPSSYFYGGRFLLLQSMYGLAPSSDGVQDAYDLHLGKINHPREENGLRAIQARGYLRHLSDEWAEESHRTNIKRKIHGVAHLTGEQISRETIMRVYRRIANGFERSMKDFDFIEQMTGYALTKNLVVEAFPQYVERRNFDTLALLVERTDAKIPNTVVQANYSKLAEHPKLENVNKWFERVQEITEIGPSEAIANKVYQRHAEQGRLDRVAQLQQVIGVIVSPSVSEAAAAYLT